MHHCMNWSLSLNLAIIWWKPSSIAVTSMPLFLLSEQPMIKNLLKKSFTIIQYKNPITYLFRCTKVGSDSKKKNKTFNTSCASLKMTI